MRYSIATLLTSTHTSVAESRPCTPVPHQYPWVFLAGFAEMHYVLRKYVPGARRFRKHIQTRPGAHLRILTYDDSARRRCVPTTVIRWICAPVRLTRGGVNSDPRSRWPLTVRGDWASLTFYVGAALSRSQPFGARMHSYLAKEAPLADPSWQMRVLAAKHRRP